MSPDFRDHDEDVPLLRTDALGQVPHVLSPPDPVEIVAPRLRHKYELSYPSGPLVKAVTAVRRAGIEVPDETVRLMDRLDELRAMGRPGNEVPVEDLSEAFAAGELDETGLEQAIAHRESERQARSDTYLRALRRARDQVFAQAYRSFWESASEIFKALQEKAEVLLDGGVDEIAWQRVWAAAQELAASGFLPFAKNASRVFGPPQLYERPDLAATWQVHELGRDGTEFLAGERRPGCRIVTYRPRRRIIRESRWTNPIDAGALTEWPDARSLRVAAEHRDTWGAALWSASEAAEHVQAWRARVEALAGGPRVDWVKKTAGIR